MPARIVVVEDDTDIQKLLTMTLEKGGFEVHCFASGREFLKARETLDPELVVLDLMLPDMDGMEICRSLRTNRATAALPILMLTARTEEMDRVLGLELGADDYVTKPFSSRELLARVKAILRRGQPREEARVLEVGGEIRIDPDRYEAFVKGNRVDLTTTEFKLLVILAERPGRVFSREQLLDKLWGGDKIVLDRTIDVHVKNLRDKLGEAGRFIRSIRAVGYKIEV